MIVTKQEPLSADRLYVDARTRWVKAVNRRVYDNEDILRRVIELLTRARRQNPLHVRSLVLLSDLLMELGAVAQAIDVVEVLLTLQPDNRTHAHKKILLNQLQLNNTADNYDAVRDFIETRWTTTNDW